MPKKSFSKEYVGNLQRQGQDSHCIVLTFIFSSLRCGKNFCKEKLENANFATGLEEILLYMKLFLCANKTII